MTSNLKDRLAGIRSARQAVAERQGPRSTGNDEEDTRNELADLLSDDEDSEEERLEQERKEEEEKRAAAAAAAKRKAGAKRPAVTVTPTHTSGATSSLKR